MATVVIGIIVAAVISAAAYKIYSDKKKGKSACGGKCSCCGGGCACHGEMKK